MMTLFHKRVCGPLANSLFLHRRARPKRTPKSNRFITDADRAFNVLLICLRAA